MITTVVGVDGCPSGWCFVTLRLSGGSIIGGCVHTVESFKDVLSICHGAAAIAVDIPIGLPELGVSRLCDGVARTCLGGKRGGAVFPCPPREVVWNCADLGHKGACGVARKLMGKGLSLQTHGILKKIKEVDACMQPSVQRRVFEVHPEVCFWAANGRSPLVHSKKAKEGKGLAERKVVLERVLPVRVVQELLEGSPPGGAARDDVLDALIAAYTAARYREGSFTSIPDKPESDSRGLRMEMIVPT